MAVFELGVGGLQHVGSDQVEGAVDVLFAVLVKDAPGAACVGLADWMDSGGREIYRPCGMPLTLGRLSKSGMLAMMCLPGSVAGLGREVAVYG